MVDQASIPSIAYEAALARLPREEMVRMLDREPVHLMVCDEIMFVRPQCSPPPEPAGEHLTAGAPLAAGAIPDPGQPPIAALLDGVPVQRHELLDGRVVIDDPDVLEDRSTVAGRHHGTAMASLIIHGDRGQSETPLSRILHIHPVMYAPEGGSDEMFRPDRLLVDTIYRAVLRMKEGDGGAEPTAPGVFLVNLSLGDQRRPYAGWISPWARLLDYLAHRYDILFVVSAGNIADRLPVPRFRTLSELESAPHSEREEAILDGLGRQRSQRTLLSPSEALNVVTVGAAHADAAGSTGSNGAGTLLDPYDDASLPNVSSATGLGHCKAIKPEILMPGGRELVRAIPSPDGYSLKPVFAGAYFGVGAASPDEQGRLDRERNRSGTSVAAALATRAAHRLFDALMDPENGGVLADAEPACYGLVVRALLVHQASWREDTASRLAGLYGPHGQGKHVARLDNVARLIGYGVPRIQAAMTCTSERATLVGHGQVQAGQTAVCRLPLPESLDGVALPRTITVTLAWFSPVDARNLAYRMARLVVEGDFKSGFGASRVKLQPSDRSIPRGTLFHQRYHGSEAVQFVQDGELAVNITCREPAGALDAPVRYGLVVTIEAEEGIPVHQEIRDRLAVRPRI